MLQSIKEFPGVITPSLICLGILRYQQERYKAAFNYLSFGIKLDNIGNRKIDIIDLIYLNFAKYRLGDTSKIAVLIELAPELNDYKQNKTSSYWYAKEELKKIINPLQDHVTG